MAKTTILEFTGKRADPAPQAATAMCAKHGDRPDALIEILHDLQAELGHVPETALPVIAKALNLSRAEVYGVLTFYHDFHTAPQPRHVIKICAAEACQSMGARELIALAEKLTKGRKVALEKTYCLGYCASSPALMVNGEPRARVDAKALKQIVGSLA